MSDAGALGLAFRGQCLGPGAAYGIPWRCLAASPGKDTTGGGHCHLSQACLLGTRPRALSPCSPWQCGRGPACLLSWSVTQPEVHANEWRNVACQIKLGASELKLHIYFNRSRCSEGDEREGR